MKKKFSESRCISIKHKPNKNGWIIIEDKDTGKLDIICLDCLKRIEKKYGELSSSA